LNDNIKPKVQFLASFWEGANLSMLLKEYPNVLTLSLDGNIQPTVSFYNQTGYVSLDSEGRLNNYSSVGANSASPTTTTLIRGRHIATSLYNRLLPRWHFCLSQNLTEHEMPPLHILTMATDTAFCEHHGFLQHEFEAFKVEAIPKLKFSSQFGMWLKTGRPIDV
jgi:hypothetical protein